MIENTSGIELDHSWLRLLGGKGDDGLPGIEEANRAAVGLMVVAYDILGGVFALDGGAFGAGDGSVHYFAPDTLRWDNLELGHSDFAEAMFSGLITAFYEPLRWPGWEQEVARLAPTEGIAVYPFLFSEEGSNPATSQRSPVTLTELLYANNAAAQQLNGPNAGPAIPLPAGTE